MKHLSRLLMLTALVIFVSCQNEELTESQSLQETDVVVDITADEDFAEGEQNVIELNDLSEKLVERSKLSSVFAKSSASCTPDIEGFTASLPETVSASTTANPALDEDGYFDLTVHDTNLAGIDIPTWCVDVDLDLGVEGPLSFDVYSSYETLPEGKFEQPENFDLVNWILNQDFIGQESETGGAFTFGHIQWAIWTLIDGRSCSTCTYITNPIGQWRDDFVNNESKGQEIVDAALANGEGFVPQCGEQIAVILIPGDRKQSILFMTEVPEIEEECKDCDGKVTDLTLEFDWKYAKRVKVYQKKEDTYWGVKIFDKVLQPGEEFSLEGVNHDGSFGKYIYIYIGDYSCYYYTKIRTDCNLKIGPGYEKGVFNVVEGRSSEGGELCEYVRPEYCWAYRHWSSYYYYKYRYVIHGY